MTRNHPLAAALLLITFLSLIPPALRAQEAVPPPPTPPDPPSSLAAVTPASAQASDRRDSFPNLNIYLPEGEFDIRIKKLIKNVLFESQINYKFVDGNISTFLRYKYYAKNFTYKFGVFDTVSFDQVATGNGDFSRVRGGLLLFEFPQDYNNRYFFLTQLDGLTFGDPDNPDNKKNNVYTKLAYQFGSPFDERLNSIVGESRGRITPVLTAYRDIGPQKVGLAVALTQGINSVGGDYKYTKFETEGLKRFDVSQSTFLISRLHIGSVLQKSRIAGTEGQPPAAQYSVPNYELFRIGGRDAMKAISDSIRGSDEIHVSNEYFVPFFRSRDYRTWLIHWNNLYGIGYAGAGNIGFDRKIFTKVGDYAADAGAGIEAGLTVRNYEVFLTVVYAKTLTGSPDLDGSKLRFSIRTSR